MATTGDGRLMTPVSRLPQDHNASRRNSELFKKWRFISLNQRAVGSILSVDSYKLGRIEHVDAWYLHTDAARHDQRPAGRVRMIVTALRGMIDRIPS
jgi:hypothetical protein